MNEEEIPLSELNNAAATDLWYHGYWMGLHRVSADKQRLIAVDGMSVLMGRWNDYIDRFNAALKINTDLAEVLYLEMIRLIPPGSPIIAELQQNIKNFKAAKEQKGEIK